MTFKKLYDAGAFFDFAQSYNVWFTPRANERPTRLDGEIITNYENDGITVIVTQATVDTASDTIVINRYERIGQ